MATNAPTQVIITDTFSQQVDKINTLSLDLGATGRLLTNQDSDTISAINEHDSAIRGTNTALVASVLTTTKKNLVYAINWAYLADTVMGGVSQGSAEFAAGALRLTGQVSTKNNGGFRKTNKERNSDFFIRWVEKRKP